MRDRPLYALTLLQLLVTAATTALAGWALPALERDYRDLQLELPALTQLALLRWPLLLVAWGALAVALAALLSRGQRRARLRIMAVVLTLSALAFVVLAMASVSPLLTG